MRNIIYVIMTGLLLLNIVLAGCSSKASGFQTNGEEVQHQAEQQEGQEATVSKEEDNSLVYNNKEYGFTFSLPESWKGYTIVTDKWEGEPLDSSQKNVTAVSGPIITIRHPEWTKENPRQDIPIMIFTLEQWKSLQDEQFHIGAAPMGPSELGRNNKYVFALPARYNYAFPPGYEEVEQIIQSGALHPMEIN